MIGEFATDELALLEAHALADRVHGEQKRENGDPYLMHLDAVEGKVEGPTRKIVARLHDVLEDAEKNGFKREEIENEVRRFGYDIHASVLHLTRKPDENYFDFITRVVDSNDPDAIFVKAADLEHNLSLSKSGSRSDKYRFALEKVKVMANKMAA